MRRVGVGGSGETVVRGSNLTQIKGHHYFNCRSKPLVGRGPLNRHTAVLLQAEAGRRRGPALARFRARVPSPREARSRGRPSAELSFGEASHASREPRAPWRRKVARKARGAWPGSRCSDAPGQGQGTALATSILVSTAAQPASAGLDPGLLRGSKEQRLNLHLDLRARQGSKSPGAVTHDNDPQTAASLGYVGLHLAALEALCRALQSPGRRPRLGLRLSHE